MGMSRVGRRWASTLVGPWAGLLLICVLLSGCGAQEARQAARARESQPDWRNTSYSVTCDGIVPGGFQATLVDGGARVPADAGRPPHYDHYDVQLEATASGDIDGDGVPDTVVVLQCSPQPSNGIVEEAQVFSGAHGRLGVLPSATTLRESTILAPLYDPAGLSIQRRDIVAEMKAYGPGDSHASGPSQRITVRWHWDGHRFVRIPT
jgi:hypothetical protein